MKFEINPELLIQPHLNGIKLIKPHSQSTLTSIGNLFSMPFITYFLSPDDTFIDANHLARVTNIPNNMGYYSDRDLKNLPLNSIFCQQTTKVLGNHNRQILISKRIAILEEAANRLDEVYISAISFKLPVYDSSNNPKAILG